jgi:7-cyano-7-deazaguanine synthase
MREAQDIGESVFSGMPPTYIPMRNSIFYSFAGSVAEEKGASIIIGGHINGDDLVFRDATRSFFRLMQKLLWEGSDILRARKTRIMIPLSKLRKYQVVKKAVVLGVPLERTWSCHRDGERHCWECDGCLSRIEAFDTAGIEDPLRNTKS